MERRSDTYSLPDVPCPICGQRSLTITSMEYDAGREEKSLLLTTTCGGCGFKHAESILLEVRQPVEYEFKVNGLDDFRIEIFRSPTATIEIPELNCALQPSQFSDGFVSTLSGILERFERITLMLMRATDDDESADKVKLVLEKIRLAKTGRFPFTLKLKDPSGKSTLVVFNKAKSK